MRFFFHTQYYFSKQVVDDLAQIAPIIERIRQALRKKDIHQMRKINDECLRELSVQFDRMPYLLALLSYSLGKILSKPRYWKRTGVLEFMRGLDSELEAAGGYAESENEKRLGGRLEKILGRLEKLDLRDKRFVKDVLTKARLKVASTLYAQGFSLGKAQEVTGIDKREILSYAGQTMMFDRVREEKGIGERLAKLRELFS
jgi:hypothetical protein